jgi:peptide subunit release factor 1 (eRF1)
MDLQRFADLRSDAGSLVSMYVDRTSGPSVTVVNELVKILKARAETAGRAIAQSIRADIDRIEGVAARLDTGGDPSWFLFASDADGVFEHHPLACGVQNFVTVGRRPHLRPLRAMRRPVESLLMVVERSRVVVYRVDGALTELGMFEADAGKENYGGFQGYEEHGATRRTGEETARIWREAGALALSAHQTAPVDMLLVSGHRHDLDHFVGQLHSYLQALPTERAVIDPRTATPAELLERARAKEPNVVRARDEQAIRSVLEGAYQGRPVARGTSAVLTAANLGAVDRLVVCGPFAKPGVRCEGCGWLARAGERCPICEAAFEQVDDVVGAAIEAVLAQGGGIAQVGVASALDADGVAATLRFPLPA